MSSAFTSLKRPADADTQARKKAAVAVDEVLLEEETVLVPQPVMYPKLTLIITHPNGERDNDPVPYRSFTLNMSSLRRFSANGMLPSSLFTSDIEVDAELLSYEPLSREDRLMFLSWLMTWKYHHKITLLVIASRNPVTAYKYVDALKKPTASVEKK